MERKIDFVRTLVYAIEENLRVADIAATTSFQKNVCQTVQKELPLLKTFLWYSGKLSGLLEVDLPSATKAIETVDCLVGIFKELEAPCQDVEDDLQDFEMFPQKLQQLHPVLKRAFLDLSDLSMGGQYFSTDDCKELLDIAVKNLKYLLVRKPDMIAPVKKQIGAVEKRLEFVSAIFHFASRDQHADQLYSFFNSMKDWANSAAAVTFHYWVDEIDERLNAMVSNLIENFKPRTIELAELYLGALKALNPSQEPDFYLKGRAVARFLEILLEDLLLPTDDGFEILEHGLTFLISFLVNPQRECAEEGKLISIHRNFCVTEAASLICSLYASNLKVDMARRSNSLLHDLIQKINQAEAEIREVQLEMQAVSRRNFPTTNVQGFLGIFIEDLKEKLKYETCTIYQRHQVMTIQKLLVSLKPSLMGVFELQDENEELKDLQTQITKMAYLAEYFIDSCFFSDPTDYWHNVMHLSDVIENIQFIKTQLNQSRHAQMGNTSVFLQKVNSKGVPSPQVNNSGMDDVMVGFADEKEKIISFLTGGLPQREIVAIVGMAGQGKTTLAKNVYHEPRVRLHFQKYAWRCISQEYKIKDVLVDILKQVGQTPNEDDISKKSLEDLAQMLYKCLKGHNYLIVLDDVWDIGAWNYLKASFPTDENGSRIMFTSRIQKVALEAKHDCIVHEPHPLSPEDSLELLQQKLSYKDGFPLNLLDIGQKIAENCKGLPLAIVVIAGLLANAGANLVYWEQIAQSLKSAKEGCMDILELSYKHLPDYLKSCFLYLAAFREDESILSKRLTRYWIAEGFVQKHEDKSLEDVADEYLMDLVGRSLLFVAKRSSKYGIKKCVLHDLVREFCLDKAKEENFLLVPHVSDSPSNVDIMRQSYRLCIHMEGCQPSFELEPAAPTVRTLLSPEPVEIAKASFFFVCFKFLRMLELECLDKNYESDAIEQLVCLRYLALRGAFHIVPSIVNLSRLKHLLLKLVTGFSFPRTIWNMISLQYLHLGYSQSYGMDDLVDESLQLDALESFTSYRECLEEELKWQLRKMPNVRKLGVRVTFCVRFSDFLHKLESLDLRVYGVKLSVTEFDLPSTLRKLTMNCSILSASVMSAIGKLDNLEVFKLVPAALEDKRWDVKDDEFLNLKYLKLRFSDIEEWNASTYSFPQLQQLIVKHCKCLTEIPSRFGVLPTLKVMKVIGCRELVNSIQEIVAEQEELGNEDLRVKIKAE